MKNKLPLYLTSAIIVILTIIIILLLVFLGNQPPQERGVKPLITIADREPDSSLWGQNFPNQYSTFLKTKDNNTRTEFGGSEPFEKLDVDPRLLVLFAGNAFSKGYGEDRGHMNSLFDVQNTPRLSDTTPGTCYSCKSANNPELWKTMGAAEYYRTPFSVLSASIDQPVGCANCHEANTMRLMVTNPALEEAFQAQTIDWTKFTRQEMRSVVCANCHVEYYFAGTGKYLTLPWELGTRIDAIETYYQEIGFSDWLHAESGANLIKIQHPEYEMFTAGSTHFNAGVACADCHMPYTRDGAAKFSSHDVKSPLLEPDRTCATCHTNVSYVIARVKIIQQTVHTTMLATEDALVDAIEAIKSAASKPQVDTQLLEKARELHRRAQLRWDFVAAENSMGFHNPEEALRILAAATDLARQAQITALLAIK